MRRAAHMWCACILLVTPATALARGPASELPTLEQTGRVLGGEIALSAANAGLVMHSLSVDAGHNLALTEHLADLYHRDMRRRLHSRHWLLPTLREISGVVTKEGVVVMDLDEKKEARLVPTLNFSTVGAKVRIRF